MHRTTSRNVASRQATSGSSMQRGQVFSRAPRAPAPATAGTVHSRAPRVNAVAETRHFPTTSNTVVTSRAPRNRPVEDATAVVSRAPRGAMLSNNTTLTSTTRSLPAPAPASNSLTATLPAHHFSPSSALAKSRSMLTVTSSPPATTSTSSSITSPPSAATLARTPSAKKTSGQTLRLLEGSTDIALRVWGEVVVDNYKVQGNPVEKGYFLELHTPVMVNENNQRFMRQFHVDPATGCVRSVNVLISSGSNVYITHFTEVQPVFEEADEGEEEDLEDFLEESEEMYGEEEQEDVQDEDQLLGEENVFDEADTDVQIVGE